MKGRCLQSQRYTPLSTGVLHSSEKCEVSKDVRGYCVSASQNTDVRVLVSVASRLQCGRVS